jgi:hypothetical protein
MEKVIGIIQPNSDDSLSPPNSAIKQWDVPAPGLWLQGSNDWKTCSNKVQSLDLTLFPEIQGAGDTRTLLLFLQNRFQEPRMEGP